MQNMFSNAERLGKIHFSNVARKREQSTLKKFIFVHHDRFVLSKKVGDIFIKLNLIS